MTIRALTSNSKTLKTIEKVEKFMDKHNIIIYGQYLRLCIDDKEFSIGRDSDSFPRTIDEPIWRY